MNLPGQIALAPERDRLPPRDNEKGPASPPGLCLLTCGSDYSRLPMKFSRNVNMFTKSRYRLSAPMMTVLPIMSVPAT